MAKGGEIVGAAPNARLMPVRMTDHLSPLQVERWFDYVTAKGAWVVSCSWSAEAAVYPLPERIAQAIHRCATEGRGGKGCVVVFAAGNNGKDVNDPPRSLNGLATHPDVLAVAASTSLDKRASYFGPRPGHRGLRALRRPRRPRHHHFRRDRHLCRRRGRRARARL